MSKLFSFRTKILPKKRAVSFRRISGQEVKGAIFINQKGLRTMVRQYLRSMEKELYRKIKLRFRYSKSKEKLYVFVGSLTSSEIDKFLQFFYQAVSSNANLEDVKTGQRIFISVDVEVLKQGEKPKDYDESEEEDEPDDEGDDDEGDEEEGDEDDDQDQREPPDQNEEPDPEPKSSPKEKAVNRDDARIMLKHEFEDIYGPDWKEEVDWDDDLNMFMGMALDEKTMRKLLGGLVVEFQDALVNLKMTNKFFVDKYSHLSEQQLVEVMQGLRALYDLTDEFAARREYIGLYIGVPEKVRQTFNQ